MISGTRTALNRRMGIAALIVSGGVLLSRLLGQIREMIFAGMLGADAVTDQYVAAFRIPDFLNYLLAGGFLSITFIPIFTRYLADDDEAGGWEALAAIIRPIAAGIVGLVVIGWVAAPTVLELIYPDFTPSQIDGAVRLTRIVLPAQLFFVIGALFAAVQYAKGKFLVPSIAPIVYNAGIISGGVIFALVSGDADPEGFAWGALAGAFVGNFALQLWGARRVGMSLGGVSGWTHPALREYVLIALPLMIGQSIVVLDETFMSVFGDLAGDGAQTQLQYARRTMFVPVGAIAQAAAVAAYPFLARLFASGRHRAMANAVDRALRWVLVLSIGAAAFVAALSLPVVRVLFERFQFGMSDTDSTAAALFFFAFAIPIWGALQILTRAFYARREMWTPVLIGSAASVGAVPLYWILQRGFGLRGVAVASVLVLGFYTIALATIWYRKPGHAGRIIKVVDTAGRAVLPAALAGFAAFIVSWGIIEALGDNSAVALIALVLGTGAFGGTALAVTTGMWALLKPTKTTEPEPRAQGPEPG
jgi:putative peptidoglycan lipid II flippase